MAKSDENGKLPRAVEQLLSRIKRIIIGGQGGNINIEWNWEILCLEARNDAALLLHYKCEVEDFCFVTDGKQAISGQIASEAFEARVVASLCL